MSPLKSLTTLCVLMVTSAMMLTPHMARAATPIITLIAPTEESPPDSMRPTFMWGLDPAIEGVTFSITIKQLDLQAMRIGKVVFEQAGIREMSLAYPAALPSLDADHAYMWTIQVFDSTGKFLAKSGPALAASFPTWSFCLLFPYPPIINVCGGTSFTLSAWALMTGTGNFNWVLTNVGTGAILSGTSTTSLLNLTVPTPPPGTYTYTLKVTRGTCTQTVPFTVNVYPALTAQVLDYPSNTPISQICITGADATLSIPNLPAGYSVNWEWKDYTNSPGAPWTGAGTGSLGVGNPKNTNPITPDCAATPGGAPSYVTRWYRATLSGGTWPCGPIFVALKVWCPTVAGTVASSIGTQICSNKTSTYNPYPIPLTVSLGGQIVGSIGNWTRTPGSITPHTGLSSFPDTIPAAGTYTYTVTVQNGSCSSATASITITVEDPLTATVTGDTHEVCPNDEAHLDVTTAPGNLIQWQYQIDSCSPGGVWINSGVNGVQSTHQNTNAIGNMGPYSPPPTQSICWRVIVSSPTGICPAIPSDPWQINIIQPPCVPTIAATGNLPKCPGTPVTLQAATTCGTGPFTWAWYLNGVLVSGPGSSSSYPAIAPGNYRVKVFNKNQCDSATSLPFTVTDCVNLVTIDGPCTADGITAITLTAQPNSQPSPACGTTYDYLWSTGATTQSITVTPTASTTYSVTVTDTDGMHCPATASIPVKVCQ